MKRRIAIIVAALAAITACNTEVGEYRNLAHFRPAYQSSSADFDQTVQLVTDGIVETEMPEMVTVYANGEAVPKPLREWATDWAFWSSCQIDTNSVDYIVYNGSELIRHDGVNIAVQFLADEDAVLSSYIASFWCKGENDNEWTLLATRSGKPMQVYGALGLMDEISFGKEYESKSIRVQIDVPGANAINFYQYNPTLKGVPQYLMDQNRFNSSWVSEGTKNEWIYVDLGEKSSFDKIVLSWLNRPIKGSILVSDDATSWKELCRLSDADTYEVKGKGRYVRVEMHGCGEQMALSEMEVWGRNGIVMPESDWKVVRADNADDPAAWIPATVPGTVLASYIDCGALPDIYYSDYVHNVSQSYFRSDFIYRGTLQAPENRGEKVWLNFDGINWKADVTMNGVELGHIAGAFTDARYDVTDIIRDGANDIEVRVYKNDHPGIGRQNTRKREAYNGGILGADNPTFHCNIGWDWIPALPGRSVGIWNDVYFTTTGNVTIEDPYLTTVLNLPDTTQAKVTIEAKLVNNGTEPVSVFVESSLKNGAENAVSSSIDLAAGESKLVSEVIILDNPKLWWPNGYGEQNLYDVRISASVNYVVTDTKEFQAGLRQMTYDTSDGRLTGWVNGRRFMAKGGNWGFSELNLRFTQREYDNAVAYHAQQNFTMIRNWVGQTGDEEFYRACDKYGIMVWQDFWLANPADGPDPYDEDMFMQNADNYVRRIRNHPSIGLYCGRNEGNPPATLDNALRALVAEKTDIQYISHSSRGLVSGEGNYWRMSSKEFFEMRGNDRIHSERGMPNMMNYESLIKMIPEDQAWPIDQPWAEHDWTREGAMRSDSFTEAVESMFGEAPDAQTYTKWAQWVNYDGYRAMFEGRSKERRGLLLWMSHSCWPSLVWSTYDYWFDPTASFYGCKKGCEPFHIQYNASTKEIEVVNVCAGRREATAVVQVLDMYGKILSEEKTDVVSEEDTTIKLAPVADPDNQAVFYIRLYLMENGKIASRNFYVQGAETDNFKALNNLPQAKVKLSETVAKVNGEYVINCTLSNTSATPAMMLHIAPYAAGERVLPYNADDNYIHLMPGESRDITVRMNADDCHGGKPSLRMEGFNL